MLGSKFVVVQFAVFAGLGLCACRSADPKEPNATDGPSTVGGGNDSAASDDSSATSSSTSSGANAGSTGGAGTGGSAGTGGNASTGGNADSGATGGSDATGGAGGSNTTAPINVGTSGSVPTARSCDDPDKGLPDDAPQLEVGVWTNITPPEIPLGVDKDVIGQGLTIDPCDPATLYWANGPYEFKHTGLYKTTNAGGTWTRLGNENLDDDISDTKTPFLWNPLRVVVDPTDQQHLYAIAGVRGSSQGFWESFDGGANWVMPDSFKAIRDDYGIYNLDLYDIAVDPTDFKHFLVTSHQVWDWDDPVYMQGSGIIETRDGGKTWIIHPPPAGKDWSKGHSINFLFAPELGIGDSGTWILGTQGEGEYNGKWRTDDWGQTWTLVSPRGIQHGGGNTYYTKDGVLYHSGVHNQRSMDNGLTWEDIGGPRGNTSLWGDGERLYAGTVFGEMTFMVSDESDGLNWAPYNDQTFNDAGPYEMVHDKVNGIIYSSGWFQGVFALKLPD